MYYRLDVDLTVQNVYLDLETDLYVSFTSGSPLAPDIAGPFRFSMEVDADEEGEAMEPIPFAFYPENALMSRSLVATLEAAGVDNLQTVPAVVVNGETGEENQDYVVANIVGLVSCANLAESDTEALADVYYFHNLIIDPASVGDLLMFRLAESQMEVIVHERVAAAIRAGEFTGIQLQPLDEAVST